MNFTLSFPGLREAEPYEWLLADEVEESVREEVEKCISDMGSDGYELIFAGDEPIPTGEPRGRHEEEAEMEAVAAAHERGIAAASAPHVAHIMSDFHHVLASREPDATAKLPDGTLVALTIETEEG